MLFTWSIGFLLTDVVMPGMNGRKLAEEARERRPGLKVLFMTGYSRNAIVHQAGWMRASN
jgi:YesN/AraC family two-component response regulator